jgi:hypothetical protein
MNFFKLDAIGYMPEYQRSEITDALHEKFDLRTDMQIISDKNMKKIIKATKK